MRVENLLRVIFSLILVIVLSSNFYTQSSLSLDYWLKITPLKNNKESVENMFLKGREGINNKYIVSYDAYYGVALVEYSTGDCKDGIVKLWNVPEWTVIEVTYLTQDDPPKLKGLLKDLGNYKTRTAGDQTDQVEYYNEKMGISITYSLTTKTVMEISVKPSFTQREKYDCSLVKQKKKPKN
ncbi:MAG TPA: hypothetical protein VGC76_18130 [Pyrinomonadaceae bacterium]|jgi:hypothetical protein